MQIIKVKDYGELSKKAASILIKRVREIPNMTLGLATGSTPIGMYKELIKDHKENHTSYQKITTFNLDEYIGLDSNDKNSYRHFMNEQLFNHIDINQSNIHIPNGNTTDSKKECDTYEQLIKEQNGIDVQILGIGGNGHIGFNEPGSSFQSRTHIVELAEKTRMDNSRFFEKMEDVPTHAITMGIATILESKEIILLASGEEKQEAMIKLLSGEVTEDFPASVLHNHPNVIVIADEAALAGVEV